MGRTKGEKLGFGGSFYRTLIGIFSKLGCLCINASSFISLFEGVINYYNYGPLTPPTVVDGLGGKLGGIYPFSGDSSTLLMERTCLKLSLLFENEALICSSF